MTSDPIDCNVLRALVERRDCCLLSTFPSQWSMLHFAARDANGSVVKTFIDAGLNIDASTDDGSRPIHIAARSGNSAAILALAGAGGFGNRS